jgi:ribosomal protein S12 methylthiotransferase accessory factor
MQIKLVGGDRVDALYEGKTIQTDQEGPLPEPFELFLASIGTCAGYYVSKFCQKRQIPTDGIRLELRRMLYPESKMIERIEIDHIEQPPAIEVRAVSARPV